MLMKSCVYVGSYNQANTYNSNDRCTKKKKIVEINEVIKAIEGHRNQIRQ